MPPLAYEHMRDAFIRVGMGKEAAEKKAAMIYNSRRGSKPPVTNKPDKGAK